MQRGIYWRFQRAKTRQRKLLAKKLAERERLETNILCISLVLSSGCEIVLQRQFFDHRLRESD
jgi:hypothetical protein